MTTRAMVAAACVPGRLALAVWSATASAEREAAERAEAAQAPAASDGWRTIAGSWSATGRRQTLPTEGDRTRGHPAALRRRRAHDSRRTQPRVPRRVHRLRRRGHAERGPMGVDRRARRPGLRPREGRADADRPPVPGPSRAGPAGTPGSRAITRSPGRSVMEADGRRPGPDHRSRRARSGGRGPERDRRRGREAVRGGRRLPRSRTPLVARLATLALALGIWFSPVPEGLTAPAWHLFALFVAAIFAVVIGAFPILTASIFALAAAVLTGTLAPATAYSGFANGTILLIVVAFLVARAVVTCGLGQRIGHAVVSLFGRSTLGLGLQHLPRGRGDRAGLPEQHGAVGRALPAGVLARRGRGRHAGRTGPPAARRRC